MPLCKLCRNNNPNGYYVAPFTQDDVPATTPVFMCQVCRDKVIDIIEKISYIIGPAIQHNYYRLHLPSAEAVRFVRLKFDIMTCVGNIIVVTNVGPNTILTRNTEEIARLVSDHIVRSIDSERTKKYACM